MFKFGVLFIAISCSLSACHILQRRSGRVKYINTSHVVKGDSIFLVPSSFLWHKYLRRDSIRWYMPGGEDFKMIKDWETAQTNTIKNFFIISPYFFGSPDSLYKERKLSPHLKSGYPTALSNLSSYNFMQFMHGVNNNQQDIAFKFIVDSIRELSYSLPVLIVTNHFWFYYAQFIGGYAQGGTGLIFSPGLHVVILKNDKVVYYRNYDKKYSYDRFMKKGFTEKVTRKLFDKLDKSEVPKGKGAGK
jgi:hypothetical protein